MKTDKIFMHKGIVVVGFHELERPGERAGRLMLGCPYTAV